MHELRYRIRLVKKGQIAFVVLAATQGGFQSTPWEGEAWTCSKATAEATARQIRRSHPRLTVTVEIAS